jgi:hypothetical protein
MEERKYYGLFADLHETSDIARELGVSLEEGARIQRERSHDKRAGSFRQINPAFKVTTLSGDALLIETIDHWELEGRIADQMHCSRSEARMSLGQWLDFPLNTREDA